MKSFIFTNAQGSFEVEFKTDYIQGDNFTVHDIVISSLSGNVTKENVIRSGINFDILPYTVAGFKLFATNNNLNLKQMDFSANESTDLVTGASDDLDITTASLAAATVDSPYSALLAVTGGFKEYSFAVVSGALPAGLSLDVRTGLISGTPTGAETANFTIEVTDILGQTNQQALSITVS